GMTAIMLPNRLRAGAHAMRKQSGRDDPCIVHYDKFVAFNEGGQMPKMAILDLARGTVEQQHASCGAVLRGFLSNGCRGQGVVEFRTAHPRMISRMLLSTCKWAY